MLTDEMIEGSGGKALLLAIKPGHFAFKITVKNAIGTAKVFIMRSGNDTILGGIAMKP